MADDHPLDWTIDEEDEAFLMSNLYPRTTGLPMTVWVGPRSGARHEVGVKVSPVHGDEMELGEATVVAVRPQPHTVHGQLSKSDLTLVGRWIDLNEAAILAHWNGETDGVELAMQLRRLES